MSDQPENVRPWGRYDIIDGEDFFQAKRITVTPGQRLSYQRHQRRAEHWIVVSGKGILTLDDEDTQLGPGSYAHVPLGARHRMSNPGTEPLVFIEVQTGDYFGEDDIERFSDDYGRS